MSKRRKPILSVDFDGVIHSYTTKWSGAHIIPDPPVPGAMEFLREATDSFTVAIFSTRSKEIEGRQAMRQWLRYCAEEQAALTDEDTDWVDLIEWPTTKPPALVMIDDRAFRFEGEWPDVQDLLSFKPWNKSGPAKG
ncbi:MAG: hypothetical protein AAFX92_03940 [Pseudomonadota bacterium]